jgi:four helix bundle protein
MEYRKDGILECWNNGIVLHLIDKKHKLWDKSYMDRINVNRGFEKLRVWQDAIALYVLACKIFTDFPFELKKVASNSIDAAHSISRNISEGYCRRSLKEYLNFLNIALGSCGEFHSCYISCRQADQISETDYERLDQLHYKLENTLLKLIASLQKKQSDKQWEDSFNPE